MGYSTKEGKSQVPKMSLAQMERRALFLEGKYQEWLENDKYLGKTSRVQDLHTQLYDLWGQISERSRVEHFKRKKG